MSIRATLETLARTVSISTLATATLAVSGAQALDIYSSRSTDELVKTSAVAHEHQAYRHREIPRASRDRLPASQRPAPKDLEARKVWLKELLHEAGFRGAALKTAWAVAMKESTGRPHAYNGNRASGDHSYGLFQINMIGDLGPERREKFGLKENEDLFDPLTNARAAYHMSAKGTNWYSWDIDENGYNGGVSEARYREWLAEYPEG